MTSAAAPVEIDLRRLLLGTLVGGVALHVLGYVIFDVAVARFYAANVGSATGLTRAPMLLWPIFVGSCAYAAMITLAIDSRPPTASLGTRMLVGAIVGFLLWGTADFIGYGATNASNLTKTIADPLLEFVRGGIGGGIIAAIIGTRREARRTSPVQTAGV